MRLWLSFVLLKMARWVHPDASPRGKVWQVIEVPRRITKTEAEMFASMVRDY